VESGKLQIDRLRHRILAWYDGAARQLPWRVGPASRRRGERPDPYRVWLSEVMLQQTTVATVVPRFQSFVARWPTVEALAAAPEAEVMAAWAGLGYYARARNLVRCARVVATERGGRFPPTSTELRRLPGIGPYTAAAIAAIAFDEPAVVIDGNIERVTARLFAIAEPLPAGRGAIARAAAEIFPSDRPGDLAQALMDLAASICRPRRPRCSDCPVRQDCRAAVAGLAEDLPRRRPRAPRETRRGTLYVARNARGAWLLERRPASGLLGGMPGWPGDDWDRGAQGDDPAGADGASGPPLPGPWRAAGTIRHVFTHFTAELDVHVAEVAGDAHPLRGAFVAAEAFDPAALPTLMKKAYARAVTALSDFESADGPP